MDLYALAIRRDGFVSEGQGRIVVSFEEAKEYIESWMAESDDFTPEMWAGLVDCGRVELYTDISVMLIAQRTM